MKFGYVTKKFNVLSSKMTYLSQKNCFCNVYFDLTQITLLVKVKNAPKFGEMLLNNVSTDCESFIKLS